nr:CRISPR-associated endonuclease Cas1 [Knoellia sp. DB2414S]
MQQLRGKEGGRVKRIYRAESKRSGVPWAKRSYRPGEAFEAGDDINRALSAAHACLYAACHAAVVGVGASPALGFVHTGGALSFVLDIADLYKADYSIPIAFDLVAQEMVEEDDVRLATRDHFRETRFMKRVVDDIFDLIMGDSSEPQDQLDRNLLWEDVGGTVAGGMNWSGFEELNVHGYATVTGPDIPEYPVDW